MFTRSLAEDEHDRDFWARHVRAGVVLMVAAALLGVVYAALTWDRPNRAAYLAVALATLAAAPVPARMPLDRILRHRRGIYVFYAWSAGVTLTISLSAYLDGDAHSPYVLLYALALVFAANAYPPAAVVGVGVLAGLCYLVSQDAPLAVRSQVLGNLALVTAMSAMVGHNHWRERQARRLGREHYDAALESANDAFVTVDAEGCIVEWNRQAEQTFGYPRDEAVGRALADTIMPRRLRDRGAAHVRRLLERAATVSGASPPVFDAVRRDGTEFPVELTIWHTDRGGERRYHAFVRDITERRQAQQERERYVGELQASRDAVARSHEETVRRLAHAAEQRDHDTGGHIDRMSRLCGLLAEWAGLGTERAQLLRIASPMHDVGKIGIPDDVLLKPGPLSPAERAVMQRHAQIGHDILAGTGVELLELAATLALTHHERYDGTGYPRGLAGEAIPIEGRIAAIADVFDALTSPRVYRPALHLDDVLRVLREGSGSHFDPALLDLFLAHLDGVLDLVDDGPDALPEAA